MQENVGTTDRMGRAFVGSALITVGMEYLFNGNRRIFGVASLVAGILIVESAITRVCPANYLAGIDTREEGDLTKWPTMERGV
jgi:hypothetical protein